MVVPYSSVNMKRLKDGNIEVCKLFFVIKNVLFFGKPKQMQVVKLNTTVNIYIRKWGSLLVINLTK